MAKFYLRSFRNRHKYPPEKYPLTHSQENVNSHKLEQERNISFFFVNFILFLILLFSGLILLQCHVMLRNAIYGPYHLNFQGFEDHVMDFFGDRQQSWWIRLQHIQVEIGEQLKFSDNIGKIYIGSTAVFKNFENTNVYIKLPTKNSSHFHSRWPFDFSKFSSRTLKCIASASHGSSKTFAEKGEYLEFIENEYSKNATRFNVRVLTKCGIFIGYLYYPERFERPYRNGERYHFHFWDIALDASRPYDQYNLIIIFSGLLMFFVIPSFFLASLYFFTVFCLKEIGFFPLPLKINESVKKELRKLMNIPEEYHCLLLKVDEKLFETVNKLFKKLFIIDNNEQLFVVKLPVSISNINEYKQKLPFIICPVNEIRKITLHGIYFVNKENEDSVLTWPTECIDEQQQFADWLHATLMEMSEDYQNQIKNPVEANIEKIVKNLNAQQEAFVRFLVEEENLRRLGFERKSWVTRFQDAINLRSGQVPPASPEDIAMFRWQEKTNPQIFTEAAEFCPVCSENIALNQQFSTWSCGFHNFHFECILKCLRERNQCPCCRHPMLFN